MTPPSEIARLLISARNALGDDGFLSESTNLLQGRIRISSERVGALLASAIQQPSSIGMETFVVREDEESDPLNADFVREDAFVGNSVAIRGEKQHFQNLFRFFLVEEGFAKFLRAGRASSASVIEVATEHNPIVTAGGTIRPWSSISSGDAYPVRGLDAVASPYRLVRTSSESKVLECISWLLPSETKSGHLDQNSVGEAWRSSAWEILPLMLASEPWETNGKLRAVIRGPVMREGEVLTPDAYTVPELELVCSAARWIYLPEAQADIRHDLLSSELARLWNDGRNWRDGLRGRLKPALESARTAYRLHVGEMSAESLRALAELRKSLIDESVRVQKSVSELMTGLWRDFIVATGALVTHFVALADAKSGDRRWVLWAAMVFVLASGSLTFIIQIRGILIARDSFEVWRKRVYAFVTSEDYKALAESPMSRVRKSYTITALVVGVLYLVLLGVLVHFLWPDILDLLNKAHRWFFA